MSSTQFLAIIAAVYVAPHLPTWLGLTFGVIFALLSLALLLAGNTK